MRQTHNRVGIYTFCTLYNKAYPCWLTMEDVDQARDCLRKFENGEYWVEDNDNSITPNSQSKQREAMIKLQELIDSHERGNSIYEPFLNFNSYREKDDDFFSKSCQSAIM